MAEGGAGVAGEVVLGDRLQPAGQRPASDPLGSVSALGRQQRHERPAHTRQRGDGGQRRAARRSLGDQQGGHRHDQKDGEVVGQQRQRPAQGEGRHRAPRAQAPRAQEEEQRQRRREHEQRVGARLLRVPEEQRVDGHQRGRHERAQAPAELLADRPCDGDRANAGERRRQPQRDGAVAQHARVKPRDQVPQRRRVLRVRDRAHRGGEAVMQDVHRRERLVVPEALQPQRRQAQGGAEDEQPGQRAPLGQRPLAHERDACARGRGAQRGHWRCSLAWPKHA